jgi:2-polyprenyl-3-methyl-5-hydroxy-6-metoxy-1,4-benzoquinol methylase
MRELNRQIKYWDSVAGKKQFTHPLNTESFQEFVPVTASILDIGCGYGRLCHELNELGYKNVVGIDMSNEMIREGIKLFPHLDLQCFISEDMPFKYDISILGSKKEYRRRTTSLSALYDMIIDFKRD